MAEKFQFVRYKSGKHTFEILCHPGTVLKYRDGQLDMDKVLFADNIFKNYSTGDRAKEAELIEVFGTSNQQECIKKILDTGEYHLSTKERQELVEKKKREMINFVHKNYIDPRNRLPHPVVRIEQAFKDLKVLNVDPFKPAEKQVQDIYSKLVEKIPLRKTLVYASLQLKHQFIGAGMPVAHRYAQVSGEKYDHIGVTMDLALPPGDYDALVNDLHKVCKGDFRLEIAASTGEKAAIPDETESTSKSKKAKKGEKK
jgi:ribosome maturation protein SDO1